MKYEEVQCNNIITEKQNISRVDSIIERLSQLDKYSREIELRANDTISKLVGDVNTLNEDVCKNPTRDGKLGDIEILISDIFINLDGLSSIVSRLDEIV